MSNTTPTLKRHNHRVHPCKNEKKEELLTLLLSQNIGKKIIVVTAELSQLTTQQENVSIVSDKELYKNPELTCELLISYDLPTQAIIYMSRITKSSSHALILLDPSEEKLLHPIERLNGRTVMQELIEGYSEALEEKLAQPAKNAEEAREERKRKFIGTDKKEKRPFSDKKPYEKREKSDKKPWDKKEKKENKFLGKDEKGKASFSGKSGERNHSYDGTPKGKSPKLTGKKISIKTLKKKD